MIFFSKKSASDLPDIRGFSLKPYRVGLPLNRLTLGTDNIRYDVHLSRTFLATAKRIALRLIARHANAELILRIDKTSNWIKERDEFKRVFSQMMTTAINKAKMGREIQIDYLAQLAIVKFLQKTIKDQFDEFSNLFKDVIRIQELADREHLHKAITLKEQLNAIQQKKTTIQFNAGRELFELVAQVLKKDSNEVREASFGIEAVLSLDLFTNPMLVIDSPFHDFFMIEEYDLLLGHRIEDPDKYDALLFTLRKLFKEIGMAGMLSGENTIPDHPQEYNELSRQPTHETKGRDEETDQLVDQWINRIDNVDVLFDFFTGEKKLKQKKKQKSEKYDLAKLQQTVENQRRLFDFFYDHLSRTDLVKRIIAYYEIKPIYNEYCPPLRPQQVLQFLISSRQRKEIVNQLNRLKGNYSTPITVQPLMKRTRSLKRVNTLKKKSYLFQFIKNFLRYHRDLLNFTLVKNAMETINVLTDEKRLNLSRANNTLYEYLLPHEEVATEKPIINHVIIKADVRGSTDLTYQMRENGMNPASYFSLNFFDPITDILPAYGATKVFIEGDALILAISEQKDNPGEWYNIARACGLAIHMLFIVRQYNKNSTKYNLPVLELGIGICFQNDSPAFLFDGDQRIMISPAINLADRLSACSKELRKVKAFADSPFNLYVFQDVAEKDLDQNADETYLRYNINGIELNAEGFAKLSEEIDLKILKHKINNENCILYSGKFPTLSGKYQQIIIREAQVQALKTYPEIEIAGVLPGKYYEVCTHPKLYEYARQKND